MPHRATWESAKVWSGGRRRSDRKAQARAFIVFNTGKAKQGKQLKKLAIVNNVDGL